MAEPFKFPGEEEKPPEKKGGFSLFKKKEPPKEEIAPAPNIMQSVNALDARAKILEGKFNDVSRKIQLTDKNMLSERNRVTREFKVLSSEILELKRSVNDILTKMDMVISELKTCSRKDELDALSKYVDLWEPVNFATKNEVKKMIEEKLGEKEEAKEQ